MQGLLLFTFTILFAKIAHHNFASKSSIWKIVVTFDFNMLAETNKTGSSSYMEMLKKEVFRKHSYMVV